MTTEKNIVWEVVSMIAAVVLTAFVTRFLVQAVLARDTLHTLEFAIVIFICGGVVGWMAARLVRHSFKTAAMGIGLFIVLGALVSWALLRTRPIG